MEQSPCQFDYGAAKDMVSEESEIGRSPALITDEAMDLVSKKGSCWSQLRFTGMMQWGKRRPVRFFGRHDKSKLDSLSEYVKDAGLDVSEQNEREEKTDRKRKKGEEDDEPKKEVLSDVRTMTRKSRRNQKEISGIQKSKKAQHGVQNQLVAYSKKKRKVSIDRWSADRYNLAEENMLKVMKAKEAVFGKPILRPALRLEARKLIGDTGLLDHLLKHMAGKVAPGGIERFRRRHNAEGAMEYWLESADLVNIRREAGVQDPYWTPPPGWQPGDNPSQDPICARELREIKQEMSKLQHDVQQLLSKKREEEMAIVTTANSCLSSNLDSDNEGSLVLLVQEMYKDLVNKKFKIEEQLKDISLAMSNLEEHLVMLKPRVQVAGETKEEEHRKKAAEEKAAKIERLKSGFRICKPQGTFIWPKMMCAHHQEVVQLDDPIMVPTPSSTTSSSSTTPSLFEPEPPHVASPSCSSPPLKPLAERRPVSTATLSHVTMSLLSSPPPSKLAISHDTQNNTSLFNLNEVPPIYESFSSFHHVMNLTRQPSLPAPTTINPHCPAAKKMEGTDKEGVKEKEKEKGLVACSHGRWHPL